MYSIEDFIACNKAENIVITQHGRKRLMERGISIQDILRAIESGEIIEQYPDDHPFPSCLILGTAFKRVLHIVASINEGSIYIITTYCPDIEMWEDDWKTRRQK